MLLDVFHQISKGIPVEKPHRKPGRIGGKAQDVERAVGVQPQLLTGKARRQALHRGAQVVVPQALGRRAVEHGPGEGLILGLRPLRPADHRGVADFFDVVPVGQEVVEGGGISKGGVFTDWRIIPLLFTV